VIVHGVRTVKLKKDPAMQASESSVERACVRIAKAAGCELLKIRGAKGWPDRLLIKRNGTMLMLEFKKEGQELQPLQRHIFAKLHDMNVKCYEIDGTALFKRLLNE
jgi:hypothetical protein